jgi:hypothetical protein
MLELFSRGATWVVCIFVPFALSSCGSSSDGSHDGSGVTSSDGACVAHPSSSETSSVDENTAAACNVEAPTSCPEPAPTYADVAPIFQRNCVTCHSGSSGGPWPLTDYTHVSSWGEVIRAELLSCSMPPPDSGCVLAAASSELVLQWIRCNMPE